MKSLHKSVWLSLALLGNSLSTGCAPLRFPSPPVEDVKPQRELRREQAMSSLNQNWDVSQYNSALTLAEAGDLRGATEHLQRLLQRSPNHREGQLLLAEVHLANQRPELAKETLQPMLLLYPTDAAVHHALGLTLESTGDLNAAVDHLHQATQLEPKAELYRVSYESLASLSSEDFDRKADQASSAPRRSAANDGSFDHPLTNQPSAASANSATNVAADPRNLIGAAQTEQAALLVNQAVYHSQQGEFVAALTSLQQAVASEPKNPLLPVAAAVYLLQCEQPETAAQLAGDATAAHPNLAPLRRVYGAACLELGDLNNAETSLRYAVSLDNTDALSYFLLGSTLIEAGKEEASRQPLSQAHRLDPRFPAVR